MNLLVDYELNKGCLKQFESFYKGFHKAIGGRVVKVSMISCIINALDTTPSWAWNNDLWFSITGF